MNVRELITRLKDCYEDEEVRICVLDDGGSVWSIHDIVADDQDEVIYIECGWGEIER